MTQMGHKVWVSSLMYCKWTVYQVHSARNSSMARVIVIFLKQYAKILWYRGANRLRPEILISDRVPALQTESTIVTNG